MAVTRYDALLNRLFIEPVRQHESAVLIATIALATIFQELMLHVFGGSFLGIPSTVAGTVTFLGVAIPTQRLLILVVAAAMLAGTWLVLYRTRLGLAIRATANDLEVANLMGMNVRTVAMATVAISVGLAAIAGVVVAPVFVVDPFMWLSPLVTMLSIVILGGLGSIKGSLVGALVIGYVEAITVFALPQGAFLKGAVALSIMVFFALCCQCHDRKRLVYLEEIDVFDLPARFLHGFAHGFGRCGSEPYRILCMAAVSHNAGQGLRPQFFGLGSRHQDHCCRAVIDG